MDRSDAVISAEQPVTEVAALSLKEALAHVIRYLQLAVERSEDIEHVHQLRIGTRRATQALRVFADFLPRRQRRRLDDQFSRLRKEVGQARDFDVFLLRFAAPGHEANGALPVAELTARRAECQRALEQLYGKWSSGEQLEAESAELCCAIRPRRSQRQRENEQFARFARRQLRATAAEFTANMRVNPRRLRRMHALRIRTKALRYTLELLEPGLSAERYRSAYVRVKQFAQRLGEINDHAMAWRLLRKLQRQFSQEAIAERLSADCRAERELLEQALAKFQKWWSPRRQDRLRRRLRKLGKAS